MHPKNPEKLAWGGPVQSVLFSKSERMVLLIILLVGLGYPTRIPAGILEVPGDYPTVQEALSSASEGDTVLVAEGTYFENLRFPPANLVLASHYIIDGDSSHIPLTILDGSQCTNPDTASIIYMDGGQDSSSAVTGFTITNGKGTLHWFYATQSFQLYGGGAYINGSSPIISHNRFTADSAFSGGGLFLGPNANAIVRHNEFSCNYAQQWGGCVRAEECSPLFHENHMHDNYAFQRTAISTDACTNIIITNNYIHHNYGISVNALMIGDGGPAYIANNIISDNICDSAAIGGAGLAVQQIEAVIENNQFLSNIGGMAYGALCLGIYSGGAVLGNLFQDNTCTVNGAAISMYISNFSITNNQFINNYCPWGGAGVYLAPGSEAYIEGNSFTGNITDQSHGSAVASYFPISCTLRNNNIHNNSDPSVGVYLETQLITLTDAVYNWWGHSSGPYHPLLNPSGLGDAVGDSVLFDPWLTEPVWASQEAPGFFPHQLLLYPAFPNPFNATTTIRFDLPVACRVRLDIFDVAGRRAASPLQGGWREAGAHEVTFAASNWASGIYLYRLKAGNFEAVGKMVLLK